MPWSEAMTPVRMRRVAVIVPEAALRGTLVRIAEAGCVELDRTEEAASGAAAVRLQRLRGGVTTTGPGTAASAVLAAEAPDLDLLQERGDVELLAGEAQLEELTEGAVRRGEVAALTGWCPAAEVPRVAGRLRPPRAARWYRFRPRAARIRRRCCGRAGPRLSRRS